MERDTFVCGDVEVVKTGRVAERGSGTKVVRLVEVTPADVDSHGNWKKWVNPASLFLVKQEEDK